MTGNQETFIDFIKIQRFEIRNGYYLLSFNVLNVHILLHLELQ